MMSMYECQGSVNQLSIDCLPLRKYVRKEFRYHNVNSVSNKRKHIHGVDAYDNAKVLSSMARRERKHTVNQAHQTMYNIVEVSTGRVLYTLKSKDLVHKCQALTSKGITYKVEIA